jgi:uncharacterized protein GlcG (DUF336 family)
VGEAAGSEGALTYHRVSVTSEAADRVVRAAAARATELGVAVNIAVVDSSGLLKAFRSMDGAPVPTIQIAQDKAYTAAGFGLPTDAWHDRLTAEPALAAGGPARIDRFIVFGGGYPLVVHGAVVGGLGVSGGATEQDMDVATGGLAALDPDRHPK